MKMEAILEQPAVEVEKLLIYANESEINKITQDAQIRARILNDVLACGLSPNQIKDVAISEKAIEQYIFSEQLKVNKALAVQHAAGKRNLIGEYALPDHLEHMQRQLLQWLNYPIHRGGDEYQHLKFVDNRFELDDEALEKEYVIRKLRFYIQGADVVEYRRLESMLEYFQDYNCPITK